METFKIIFFGRLDFGNARSYDQVLKMYEHRFENYYRRGILLEAEDIFNEDEFLLDIPRRIVQATSKDWNNTINLLKFVVQYAISGNIRAWKLKDGKCLQQEFIEPKGDKSAVQQFLKGRDLLKIEGKEEEAAKALSRAIEKFERHALAYERRGYINYRLKNYKDAIYDYTKSIDYSPVNAEPYLGRAYTKVAMGDAQGAIEDFGLTIKRSIPHQPLYYQARRIKGNLHLELGEYELAIKEFRLFTLKAFEPSNPNYGKRKDVFLNYGKALLSTGMYTEAIEMINNSMALQEKDSEKDFSIEQPLLLRGIARKKAGKKGYKKDWKEAASMGSQEAKKLLSDTK